MSRGACILRPPARAAYQPRTGRQACWVLPYTQELAARGVAPEHVRAALKEVFGPSGTVQLGGGRGGPLDERERGEGLDCGTVSRSSLSMVAVSHAAMTGASLRCMERADTLWEGVAAHLVCHLTCKRNSRGSCHNYQLR